MQISTQWKMKGGKNIRGDVGKNGKIAELYKDISLEDAEKKE